jgi:hypothetical protein
MRNAVRLLLVVVGASWVQTEIDGNGKVDLTDCGILEEIFGKSGAVKPPVPAPGVLASVGLASLAAAGLFFWGQSRRRGSCRSPVVR